MHSFGSHLIEYKKYSNLCALSQDMSSQIPFNLLFTLKSQLLITSLASTTMLVSTDTDLVRGSAKFKKFKKSKINWDRAHSTHPPPSKLFFFETHH